MSPFAASQAPRPLRTWLCSLLSLALVSIGARAQEDGPLLLPLPPVPLNSQEHAAGDVSVFNPPFSLPPGAIASPLPSPLQPKNASIPPTPLTVSPVPPKPPAPSAAIELTVHGPENMRAHEEATFAIVIVNKTATETSPLRVVATIPEHLEPKGLTPENGCLNWPIDPLKPGADFKIEFRAVAHAAIPIHIKAVVHLEIAADFMTRVTQPQLKLHFHGPEKVELGETFDCVLTITNPGSGMLSRGGLALMPSKGLRIDNAPEAPEGPYDLEPGEAMRIPMKVTAIAPGTQRIAIEAEADGGLDAECVWHFLVKKPVFEIAIIGPKARLVGTPGHYELTVVNIGDAVARDSLAFIELPAELEFLSAKSGGTYDPRQHLVYWNLGDLAIGQQSQLSVTACPKGAGELECRGSVKDRIGADGEAYWTTQAIGQASLSLQLQPDCDIAKTGDQIRYVFVISNRGSLAAKDAALAVEAVDGLIVEEKVSAGWTEEDGQWKYRPIEKIPPGNQEEILLVLRATKPGAKRIAASVQSPDIPGKVSAAEAIRIFELEE